MDMATLVNTSRVVKEANDKGISVMWGNDVLLQPEVFNQVVEDYGIIPEVIHVSGNTIEIRFSREGLNFFMIVTEQQYKDMKKRSA